MDRLIHRMKIFITGPESALSLQGRKGDPQGSLEVRHSERKPGTGDLVNECTHSGVTLHCNFLQGKSWDDAFPGESHEHVDGPFYSSPD